MRGLSRIQNDPRFDLVLRSLEPWATISRDWEGETAFIVGGGPSVASQDVELLRGRKIIVINSSYESVPFADYLIYSDPEWWLNHYSKLLKFKGRIVSPVSHKNRSSRYLFMRKVSPPGLSHDPQCLAMYKTTFTAAINLVVHLGVNRIVLLGADGKMGIDHDGTPLSHHHAPHVGWTFRSARWDEHRAELQTIAKPLADLEIEVINASPGSAWNIWPIMSLEEAIQCTAL